MQMQILIAAVIGETIAAAPVLAGVIDEARVAVIGGSHGGFLTGNLVGQHPARFRCGVLRNPVMDLGLMIHVSDIPDWVYIEAWGPKARTCCGLDAVTPQTFPKESIVLAANVPHCHLRKPECPADCGACEAKTGEHGLLAAYAGDWQVSLL